MWLLEDTTFVFGSSANNVEDCEAIVRWVRERG